MKFEEAKFRKKYRHAEHILSCQYYQDQPYTLAVVSIKYGDKWYDALGFAKVRYLDTFDPEYRKQLAVRKAVSKVANQVWSEMTC